MRAREDGRRGNGTEKRRQRVGYDRESKGEEELKGGLGGRSGRTGSSVRAAGQRPNTRKDESEQHAIDQAMEDREEFRREFAYRLANKALG
jgi:hypothetical protein